MEPTTNDIVYAAGFFDGEGCVYFVKASSGYQLRACVGQKDIRPLYWLRERWGGCLNNNGATTIWQVASKKAFAFLTDIRPFLIVKREQVDFALSKYTPGNASEITAQDKARLSEMKVVR